MKQTSRSKHILIWTGIAVLAIGTLLHSARRTYKLRPANAVGFFYKNMKKLQFRNLIPYTTGPEKRRMKRAALRLQHSKTAYWNYRKNMKKMVGYKVTRIRNYDNIAAVDFVWKILSLVPSKKNSNVPIKKISKKPFTLLLLKKSDAWYVASTRPNDGAYNRELQSFFSNTRITNTETKPPKKQ